MERQKLNVFRMRLLGAEVIGVDAGSRTLKDAINEAMRDWVTNVRTSHYLLGSVLGAHPYPQMVRDFQKIIGEEARAQILEAEGRLAGLFFACVGGGSNAIGLFHAFLGRRRRENGGRRGGRPGENLGEHAARLAGPKALPAHVRACCKAPTPTFCKRPTAKSRRPIRFPRGSIIPAVARACVACGSWPRRIYGHQRRSSDCGGANAGAQGRNYSGARIGARAGGIDSRARQK